MNRGGFKNVTFSTSLTKKLWQNTSFDFIGKRKPAFIVVLAVVAIITVSLFTRGLSLGIDFSGGRNYIVQFDHAVKTNELQNKLQPLFGDAAVSVITIDNDTKVRISTNYDSDSENIDDEIMEKLYKGLESELNGMSQADFSTSNEAIGVQSAEKVGPSIAADITVGAIWAVALSLLAMALYILLRFHNLSFSLLSLIHI